MKVVKKLLLGIMLSLYSVILFANPNYRGNKEEYDSLVGIGYKHYWIRARDDWKRLTKGNSTGFNVFAGWRFHPYFGTEIGYEWTEDKPHSMSWSTNESLLTLSNSSGQTIPLDTKIRFKSGYLDLNMFMPIALSEHWTPEGVFSIGVASVKPTFKIRSSDTLNAGATQLVSELQSLEGKTKAIWRLGFGLQTLIFGDVGVRLLWRFENTSELRLRNGAIAENPKTRVMFNNGQTLTLGIYKRV